MYTPQLAHLFRPLGGLATSAWHAGHVVASNGSAFLSAVLKVRASGRGGTTGQLGSSWAGTTSLEAVRAGSRARVLDRSGEPEIDRPGAERDPCTSVGGVAYPALTARWSTTSTLGLVDDWIKTLNANSGTVAAVAAVLYTAITLALLLEARSSRNLGRKANVDARAKAHQPAPQLLELEVRNFGPANARDVVIAYHLTAPDGSLVGDKFHRAETMLGVGEGLRFLPGAPKQLDELETMAAARTILHVTVSWTDGRRRLAFFPRRNTRQREWAATDLHRDLIPGGWSLAEPDIAEDLHEIAEKMREIERHQKEGRLVIERGVNAFIRDLKDKASPPD